MSFVIWKDYKKIHPEKILNGAGLLRKHSRRVEIIQTHTNQKQLPVSEMYTILFLLPIIISELHNLFHLTKLRLVRTKML